MGAHPPRQSFELIVDRRFGPFIAGRVLSSTGIWIHNVTAAIVVYEGTGSSLLVALVSVAQFAPQLILTPWSGSMADRGSGETQIVLGRLVTFAASGTLAVLIHLHVLSDLNVGLAVIATSLAAGFGFAVSAPPTQALVPALVDGPELPAAVALMSVPPTIARVAGPVVAAFLLTSTGAASAFALASLGHLALAAVVFRLRAEPHERRHTPDSSIRAALRYLHGVRPIITLLFGIAAVGLAIDPVLTLTPALVDHLNEDQAMVGSLTALFGVGAGCAFVILRPARKRLGLRNLCWIGLVLLGASMTAVAMVTKEPVIICGYVVGGMGMTVSVTAMTTLVHQYVADGYRGRVMALWSVAFLGSRPLAAGLNGAIADIWSVQWALVIVGLFSCLGAVMVRPTKIAPVST